MKLLKLLKKIARGKLTYRSLKNKIMKKIELYFLVVILITMVSCDLQKEPIPAYLHIEPFAVDVNGNQGTKAQQIRDAWVSDALTGDFLGVYELPATLPIIAEGNTDLIIQPGILENGIQATPNIYSFMKRYAVSVDFTAGEIDTIQPVTGYDPRVIFHYQDDFNGTNTLQEVLDTNLMMNTSIFSEANGAFEGGSVGFTLDADNPRFEVATTTLIELPTKGDAVIMEMHYKTEGILQVAVVGYIGTNPDFVKTFFFAMNPQSSWNKIYINLTNQLVAYGSQFTKFRILFGSQIPEGQSSATYLIDNLKIMELPDD